MADIRKFMDMLSEETLTELNWQEKSPLAPVLAKYSGKFIHFSQINKLGINPRKNHSDPHGIYFYPIDWLRTTNYDRVQHGNQYGLDWPFYFVADVVWSQPGIVLSKLTEHDLEVIANQNGWIGFLADYKEHGSVAPKLAVPTVRINLPSYATDAPGSILWHLCDVLQQHGTMKWSQLLKGIAYIYDDGNAIIHSNEPAQLLVLQPNAIRVIDSGKNVNVSYRNTEDWAHWSHAIKTLFETVSKKYDGNLVWKNKRPKVSFSVNGKNFNLEFYEKWGMSLYLHFAYGRAKGYRKIESTDLRNLSADALLAKIESYISEVAEFDDDLLFQPIIPEDRAHLFAEGKIFDNLDDVVWETEINNDDDKYAKISTDGTFSTEVDGVQVGARVHLNIYHDHFTISLNIDANGQSLSTATLHEHITYAPDCIEPLFNEMVKGLGHIEDMYVKQPDENYYRPKFDDSAQWTQFLGFVMANCGLSFGGRVERFFAKQIEAYEQSDKDDLAYYTRKVMRKI
jgi:hypothetical protein